MRSNYFDSVLSCSYFIQYNKRDYIWGAINTEIISMMIAVMQNNKHFTTIKVDW
jgi:uncharacterized protein YifN (PemK superfamily)